MRAPDKMDMPGHGREDIGDGGRIRSRALIRAIPAQTIALQDRGTYQDTVLPPAEKQVPAIEIIPQDSPVGTWVLPWERGARI